MTTKLCIDCKHMRWANSNSIFYPLFRGEALCTRQKMINLIDGTVYDSGFYAAWERKQGECGVEAKYFEEKQKKD